MAELNQNFYKYTFNKVLSEIEFAQLYALGFEAFEEKETTSEGYLLESLASDKLDFSIQSITHFSSKELVLQQNWNALWESGFEPIAVDDKIFIRASFHQKSHFPIEIIIDPKMAFGTGHHATTFMVLHEMLSLCFMDKKVLDFGCGSGILAIAAEKLGAANVLAIDYDHWSVENTMENTALNECTKIKTLLADNLNLQLDSYAIVLANITRDILLTTSNDIYRLLCPGGIAIYSGFIPCDVLIVKKYLNNLGVSRLKMIQKDDWACLVWQKE